MKASMFYRISAVLLLLFDAGPTSGFPWSDPKWGVDLGPMQSTHFYVMGFSRTYWDFYVGFGPFVTVFLLLAVVMAWQLGGLPPESLARMRGTAWAFALCFVAITVLSWKYFFIIPIVFSIVTTLCLTVADGFQGSRLPCLRRDSGAFWFSTESQDGLALGFCSSFELTLPFTGVCHLSLNSSEIVNVYAACNGVAYARTSEPCCFGYALQGISGKVSSVTSTSDLACLDLSEASQRIQKRSLSPVELTKACLQRIEQLNPQLNAFITITADSAMEEAQTAEKEIGEGKWRGPLHGIPMAVKDLVETANVRTTAGSRVLENYVPTKDAPIIQRLREAGGVLLGKLNLHEFAYGASSMISHFGVVKNPWNTAHIAGGSSSGSAAAVAAALCFGAIGTDTAGSIRLPSSYCGIVGLKPSYGLVSTRGIIPLSWTHDHAGPMTRTVADTALLLQAIANYDSEDIYSHRFSPVHYPAAMEEKPSSLRLGVPHEFFWQQLDPEIALAAEIALKLLVQLTVGARDISVPIPNDTAVFRCEPFVYHQKYLERHATEYDPETLRRIRTGERVTATEYVDGYRKLLKLRREILGTFEEVDLLITPTSPILPPTIAALEAAPQDLRPTEMLMLRNTRPFNVFGLPAISVPCGFSESGLPIGMQITGAPGAEGTVLALARAYEAETDWHKRKPLD